MWQGVSSYRGMGSTEFNFYAKGKRKMVACVSKLGLVAYTTQHPAPSTLALENGVNWDPLAEGVAAISPCKRPACAQGTLEASGLRYSCVACRSVAWCGVACASLVMGAYAGLNGANCLWDRYCR
jgi:hypothetical protein